MGHVHYPKHIVDEAVRLYTEEGKTQTEAAATVGVHQTTLRGWLIQRGLQTDTHRRARVLTDAMIDEIVRMYKDDYSCTEIARAVGLKKTNTIYSALRARGCPRRAPHTSSVGRKCPPGSTSTTSDGYVVEKVPNDWPYLRQMNGQGDGSWILQHRKVMAEHLGRPLLKGEQVHHINGKRSDNRPENLQLRHGAHGNGQKLRCSKCKCGDLEAVPLD